MEASLCLAAQSLSRFVAAVQKLTGNEKKTYLSAENSASQLIEVLKCLGIKINLCAK